MKMKVLGGRNLPDYWTRFDQLQRTAHKLRGTIGSPRGVFRFSSFEAFECMNPPIPCIGENVEMCGNCG